MGLTATIDFLNLVISNFVPDLQRMSFEIIVRFPLDTFFVAEQCKIMGISE